MAVESGGGDHGSSALVDDLLSTYPYLQSLNQDANWAQRCEQAQSFLQWAKNHPHIHREMSEIPIGILPNNRAGHLYDFKVKCKKYTPDDEVYNNNEDIRLRLARGNTVLEILDGSQRGSCLCLVGLRKFTGGTPGDEDDKSHFRGDRKGGKSGRSASRGDTAGACGDKDKDIWKLYFVKPIDEASKVVATKKMNGEALHLACVRIEGTPVLLCGSKNNHAAIQKREDMNHYRGDRWRLVKQFVNSAMDTLQALTDDQRLGFLEFLMRTGFTAVFEILCPDHQHVENLSDLKQNQLKFIAWTSPNSSDLLAVPPHDGIEIARSFGLDTTIHEIVPIDKSQAYMAKIRLEHGHEGVVMYYLNNTQATIGLLKLKTIWYVVCRAIREKAKAAAAAHQNNTSSFSLSRAQNSLEKRLAEIQSWLQFSDAVRARWTDLGRAFLHYCIRVRYFAPQDLADMFPFAWRQFLDDRGLSDHFEENM